MEIGDEGICKGCGEECILVMVDESFDYAGTHCTGGGSGTHIVRYPGSSCCGEEVEDLEE